MEGASSNAMMSEVPGRISAGLLVVLVLIFAVLDVDSQSTTTAAKQTVWAIADDVDDGSDELIHIFDVDGCGCAVADHSEEGSAIRNASTPAKGKQSSVSALMRGPPGHLDPGPTSSRPSAPINCSITFALPTRQQSATHWIYEGSDRVEPALSFDLATAAQGRWLYFDQAQPDDDVEEEDGLRCSLLGGRSILQTSRPEGSHA